MNTARISPLLAMALLLGPISRGVAGYAAYHRSGHATIDKEIEVGDVTRPVGADVDTVFDFDIIRGTYSYAVFQDDRMRVALGLGVYAVPRRYSLHHLPALSGTGPRGSAA